MKHLAQLNRKIRLIKNIIKNDTEKQPHCFLSIFRKQKRNCGIEKILLSHSNYYERTKKSFNVSDDRNLDIQKITAIKFQSEWYAKNYFNAIRNTRTNTKVVFYGKFYKIQNNMSTKLVVFRNWYVNNFL